MKDEAKEMDYRLGQILSQFGYTNIIDATFKEIESQLGWDYLTWKKFKYYYTTKGIFKEIDHHKSNKRNMLLITLTHYEDIELINSELRMCRANIDNVLTPIRHYSHSREIECFDYDPAFWAIKTTLNYNSQTSTPKVNSEPAETLSEGLNDTPEPIQPEPKTTERKTQQMPRAQSAIKSPVKQRVSRWQHEKLGRKWLEVYLGDSEETKKVWVNRKEKKAYDAYGMNLGEYRERVGIFKCLLQELMNLIVAAGKGIWYHTVYKHKDSDDFILGLIFYPAIVISLIVGYFMFLF